YLAPAVAPSSDVTMGGRRLTNLGTPSAGTDAATKAYVDASGSSGTTAYSPVINVMNPAVWPAGGVGPGNPAGLTTPPFDDADAIQAIINAYPGRTIYLPRTFTAPHFVPSYFLTKTLTLPVGGQILRGDGGDWGGTTLKFPPGVTGIVMMG